MFVTSHPKGMCHIQGDLNRRVELYISCFVITKRFSRNREMMDWTLFFLQTLVTVYSWLGTTSQKTWIYKLSSTGFWNISIIKYKMIVL